MTPLAAHCIADVWRHHSYMSWLRDPAIKWDTHVALEEFQAWLNSRNWDTLELKLAHLASDLDPNLVVRVQTQES